MGPGDDATAKDIECAFEIGKGIAEQGWVLLTGGRNVGVMDAASKGAKEAGGLTIGILPGANRSSMSDFVDIPIVTDMGSARNNINVLSCDFVIACGSGLGTASEIMLALKANKLVLFINQEQSLLNFLDKHSSQKFHRYTSPKHLIDSIAAIL